MVPIFVVVGLLLLLLLLLGQTAAIIYASELDLPGVPESRERASLISDDSLATLTQTLMSHELLLRLYKFNLRSVP